jgi:DNA-binding HxlR family transcriptional regulator
MTKRDLSGEACSIARPAALLGDTWTMLILRQCFRGMRRFEEFQSSLGMSRPVLADRLDLLVTAGVLERRPYAEAQRTRHEYRLTDVGMDLYPVLMALRTFADKHMSPPEGPIALYRHRGCGGLAESVHRCTECGDELTARDVAPERGPGMPPGTAVHGFAASIA